MVLGVVARNVELVSSVQLVQVNLGLLAGTVGLLTAQAAGNSVTPESAGAAAYLTNQIGLRKEDDQQHHKAYDLTSFHVPLDVDVPEFAKKDRHELSILLK